MAGSIASVRPRGSSNASGGRYMLLMNFAEGRREAAMGFIRAAFPGAVLVRNLPIRCLCASRAGPWKARNARPCPPSSPQCWARPMATISRPVLCRKSGLRRYSKRCWRGPKGEHGQDKHRLTSSITLLFFTIRSSSHRSPIQNHDYRCEYPSPWVPFESWK